MSDVQHTNYNKCLDSLKDMLRDRLSLLICLVEVNAMDVNMSILVIISCICIFFVIGKIFIVPIKWIAKLILNSILGGVLIWIINLIGGIWSFHIGLNLWTSILVGILGVPGALLLIFIRLMVGV